MERTFRALGFACVIVGLFPAILDAQDSPPPTIEPELNPGDGVQLVVWRNSEMSGAFEVRPDSTLGHPILQDVKVAGVPLSVAEQRLRAFLGRFESNPSLVLLPRYRVFIGGNAISPTFHTLSPNVSIAEAVLLAGGTPDLVRMDRVRLVREGQEQVLDLTSMDSRHARQLIRSGDQILLERRRRILRDYIFPGVRLIGAVTAILTFARRI